MQGSHHRAHKTLLPVCNFIKKSFFNILSCVLKRHFNIILPPQLGLPGRLFLQTFKRNRLYESLSSYAAFIFPVLPCEPVWNITMQHSDTFSTRQVIAWYCKGNHSNQCGWEIPHPVPFARENRCNLRCFYPVAGRCHFVVALTGIRLMKI
jgi:hypothetical protein